MESKAGFFVVAQLIRNFPFLKSLKNSWTGRRGPILMEKNAPHVLLGMKKSTPWNINGCKPKVMEVWFRWFSFSNRWFLGEAC